ncbi:hypothetical protein ACNQR7_32605 [Mycolicibacterium senegalense]|uniref:hypothetical protein n=1 Tax=Mycolicibacterium senegalense TaxID=1796 RepID=UPI003AAD2BEF
MTTSRAGARRSPNVARQRALRRLDELQRGLDSPFEALADLYHDQGWRHINDSRGRPYEKFTAFVQDQLSCGASNARRYRQAVVSLVLPLRELTAPGTPIPVTSADVARLGVAGARSVVTQARVALRGVPRRDQVAVLRGLLDATEGARRCAVDDGAAQTAPQQGADGACGADTAALDGADLAVAAVGVATAERLTQAEDCVRAAPRTADRGEQLQLFAAD